MQSKKLGHALCGTTLVRLLPKAQAVIDVAGLCRIVEQPSGEPKFELIKRDFAHKMVAEAELGREERGTWLEAVDYATGKVLRFDCRGLSMDWEERHYQLYWFDDGGFLGDRGDTVKRYRKVYHRAKGFKLGRLLRGPAKAATAVKLFKPAKADRRPFRSAS